MESEKVTYWASDSDKIKELIDYIQNNKDLFYVENLSFTSHMVLDNSYINAFKIDVSTDEKTYEYLSLKYIRLFNKYHARNINISYLKLQSIGDQIKEIILEEW